MVEQSRAKRFGWLWVVGIFGCSAVAMAQTPPASTAGTRFDGMYAFVSSRVLSTPAAMGRPQFLWSRSVPAVAPTRRLPICYQTLRYQSSRSYKTLI
jgi:hypothetical protein